MNETFPARADALGPLISQHANWNDEHRRLAQTVAQALAEQGLYRSSMPASVGGAGASPRAQIETIESVSRNDGATGWNLMIGMENFGLIAPLMVNCAKLIEDPSLILCSSTAAAGQLETGDGGYRVTGRWPFVSGCHNSQLFCATVLRDSQDPTSRCYAVLTPDQYKILDTWHVSGMRGSGSHDIEATGAFVPAERLLPAMDRAAATNQIDDALRRFPLGARLSYNKVAVALGITRGALDAFYELAAVKTPRFHSSKLASSSAAALDVAQTEVVLRSARSLTLELVDALWDKVQRRQRIDGSERALFHIACSDAVERCAQAVGALGRAAGTDAIRAQTTLNRCIQDIVVVRTHTTVNATHIEDGGRVLLGQPPKGLMLKGLG